jgi:hypothetical protein
MRLAAGMLGDIVAGICLSSAIKFWREWKDSLGKDSLQEFAHLTGVDRSMRRDGSLSLPADRYNAESAKIAKENQGIVDHLLPLLLGAPCVLGVESLSG